jgi:cytochrome c oxidase subunit 3
VYFTGPGSNAAGSFFYVITLAHLLHVVAGLIVLMVMLRKAIQLKYTSQDHLGLDLGMMFWHFLGVLWLYLFLFLAIIR